MTPSPASVVRARHGWTDQSTDSVTGAMVGTTLGAVASAAVGAALVRQVQPHGVAGRVPGRTEPRDGAGDVQHRCSLRAGQPRRRAGPALPVATTGRALRRRRGARQGRVLVLELRAGDGPAGPVGPEPAAPHRRARHGDRRRRRGTRDPGRTGLRRPRRAARRWGGLRVVGRPRLALRGRRVDARSRPAAHLLAAGR